MTRSLSGGSLSKVISSLINSMIFWDILYRSQQSVSISFIEDTRDGSEWIKKESPKPLHLLHGFFDKRQYAFHFRFRDSSEL